MYGNGGTVNHYNTNHYFKSTTSNLQAHISDTGLGIGTSPSQKLTVSGNGMLAVTDGFMYLSNIGTGNSGIYVRGIGGSNTLRSHSTGSFRWEVNGAEEMALTTNYLNVNGYVRGDYFSDRNNTAYYVDPASDSKFHAINFDNTAVTPPTTTNATAGARLNLYPQGSGRDYSIGIESSNMWFNTDGGFKFYEDGNARMQMETVVT